MRFLSGSPIGHGIKVALAAGTLLSSLVVGSVAYAEGTVTFTAWGGSYQDGLRSTILTPAAKKLGLVVKEDTTSGIQDVRAQITARAVTWDVASYAIDACSTLSNEGLLEPLDYSVIKADGIPSPLVHKDWIGFDNYSKVIAWQKSKFGEDGPKNWVDFWDLKRFPGPRALYGKVNDALEAALMADGVAAGDVYKVLATDAGIDRGFKKLEQLAPSVRAWYTGGSQASQLMKDGEVDLIEMANNRLDAIIKDGANVGYTYNQGALEYDCLLVPRGAPHKAAAMQLIAEAVDANRQAAMAKLLNVGPANVKALDTGLFSPAEAARMNISPDNLKEQIIIDPAFYTPRIANLQERFDAIMQK